MLFYAYAVAAARARARRRTQAPLGFTPTPNRSAPGRKSNTWRRRLAAALSVFTCGRIG